jgi:hypothetical protein
MNVETLAVILRGGHVSMPDRISRGDWPHPPLQMTELVSSVADSLQRERWFPKAIGHFVGDGTVIERRDQNHYVCRTWRSLATDPSRTRVAEHVFSDAREAAKFYLVAELNLPGDLDGWKVIDK